MTFCTATELAENNVDWFATAAIYGDETEVLALRQHQGFCGTVKLTINVATTVFCRKSTNQGHHRYFTLDKPPILHVALEYIYENTEDEDTGFPIKLTIQWVHYPDELPAQDKLNLISWLTKKCEDQMRSEMFSSFGVIEICEHEVLSYWEMVHQNDDYQLIMLPPKMDTPHHSNTGVLVHPRNEAIEQLHRQNIHHLVEVANDDVDVIQDIQEYVKLALVQCWPKMYESICPICFDMLRCDQGTTLPCGDFYCNDCFPMYLHAKVTELPEHRQNPFLCPIKNCRAKIDIEQIVKQHTSTQDHTKIERWQRDLAFPPCHLFDRCPSKSCTSNNATKTEEGYCMRRFNMGRYSMGSKFIFCEVCDKSWCVLCMRRIDVNITIDEHNAVCESAATIKFCRRYLRSSEKMKQRCETMYPWICIYARGIQGEDDIGVNAWISENGQHCPGCAMGVERISGCFHMKCSNCATHFCHECGQELFAPFYGTHHCWEEQE